MAVNCGSVSHWTKQNSRFTWTIGALRTGRQNSRLTWTVGTLRIERHKIWQTIGNYSLSLWHVGVLDFGLLPSGVLDINS